MKMKKIIYILLGCVALSGMSSCEKYLNKIPDDVLTVDDIFKSKANTDRFLANIYYVIPNELAQRFVNNENSGVWTAASDEAKYTWDFVYTNNMNRSVWNNTDGAVASYWTNYYKGIRNATYFIQNIDKANAAEVNELMKTTYKAEARALRALYYFYLARIYGAVPVIGEGYLDINVPLSELKLERLL